MSAVHELSQTVALPWSVSFRRAGVSAPIVAALERDRVALNIDFSPQSEIHHGDAPELRGLSYITEGG